LSSSGTVWKPKWVLLVMAVFKDEPALYKSHPTRSWLVGPLEQGKNPRLVPRQE
jgi:hypothetical protein